MRRYTRDQRIAGGLLGSSQTTFRIRRARDLGLIPMRQVILSESQRLDHLANKYLNDAQLWWVLAATSDIGWGLQVPPGTIINIPLDMSAISKIVG